MLNEVSHGWAFLRIALEHPLDQLLKELRIPLRNAFNISVDDFCGKSQVIGGLERRLQGHHLIEYTACGPDVCLLVIIRFVNLLWGHIVGRSHVCLCVLRFSRKDPRESKVSKLNVIALVEEDITRLDISMQNAAEILVFVTLPQSQNDLHKNLPNDVFSHIVLLILAFLNELCHVSVLAVFHDNVELSGLFI
jgi:hypothetical protein